MRSSLFRYFLIVVAEIHFPTLEMVAGFWNVQTEQAVKVSDIRDEITPENRICTLEQAEVYVKAVENFMEEMKMPENARNNCPVYRTHNEGYVRDR